MESTLEEARRYATLATSWHNMESNHALSALIECASFVRKACSRYVAYIAYMSSSGMEQPKVLGEFLHFALAHPTLHRVPVAGLIQCLCVLYRSGAECEVGSFEELVAQINNLVVATQCAKKDAKCAEITCEALLTLDAANPLPPSLLGLMVSVVKQSNNSKCEELLSRLGAQLQMLHKAGPTEKKQYDALVEMLVQLQGEVGVADAVAKAARSALEATNDFIVEVKHPITHKTLRSFATLRAAVEPLTRLSAASLSGGEGKLVIEWEDAHAVETVAVWLQRREFIFPVTSSFVSLLRFIDMAGLGAELCHVAQRRLLDHVSSVSSAHLIEALSLVSLQQGIPMPLFAHSLNIELGTRFVSSFTSAASKGPDALQETMDAFAAWKERDACFQRITINHASIWLADWTEETLVKLLRLVRTHGVVEEIPPLVVRKSTQQRWIDATVEFCLVCGGNALPEHAWSNIYHAWSGEEIVRFFKGAASAIPDAAQLLSQPFLGSNESFLERFFENKEMLDLFVELGGKFRSASTHLCVVCRALSFGAETLQFVCEHCDDLDGCCNTDALSPLQRAVSGSGGCAAVTVLLKHGASGSLVAIPSGSPATPLINSTSGLFSHATLSRLATPLALACSSPSTALEMVTCLLDLVPAQTEGETVTALMVASWFGSLDVVELLWEHGADPASRCGCYRNFTCWDFAMDSLQESVLIFLLPHCAFLDLPLLLTEKAERLQQLPRLHKAILARLQHMETNAPATWSGRAEVQLGAHHRAAADISLGGHQLIVDLGPRHPFSKRFRKAFALSPDTLVDFSNDLRTINIAFPKKNVSLSFRDDETAYRDVRAALLGSGVSVMSSSFAKHFVPN